MTLKRIIPATVPSNFQVEMVCKLTRAILPRTSQPALSLFLFLESFPNFCASRSIFSPLDERISLHPVSQWFLRSCCQGFLHYHWFSKLLIGLTRWMNIVNAFAVGTIVLMPVLQTLIACIVTASRHGWYYLHERYVYMLSLQPAQDSLLPSTMQIIVVTLYVRVGVIVITRC